MKLFLAALLWGILFLGCDFGVPCQEFECHISGTWDLTAIDGKAGRWGVFEMYKDQTGGRLTVYQETGEVLMKTAFGGGYWGGGDFYHRLSFWNVTTPDGRIMSYEAQVTEWTKTSFSLKITKPHNDNYLSFFKLNTTWMLKKRS